MQFLQPLQVSEILPLKQGLKHPDNGLHYSKNLGLRDTSIKTRIETYLSFCNSQLLREVSEILPLKQGLKLYELSLAQLELRGLRDTSIKTRIETSG